MITATGWLRRRAVSDERASDGAKVVARTHCEMPGSHHVTGLMRGFDERPPWFPDATAWPLSLGRPVSRLNSGRQPNSTKDQKDSKPVQALKAR